MEKIDRKTYLKLIKYSLNHLLDLSVSIYSLNTDAFIDQESGVIYKCYCKLPEQIEVNRLNYYTSPINLEVPEMYEINEYIKTKCYNGKITSSYFYSFIKDLKTIKKTNAKR